MKALAAAGLLRCVSLLAGSAARTRLNVLIFHRVLPAHDPLRPSEPTVAEFTSQMQVLREHFHPLPLLEAVARLREGSLPPRAVCVTFDDGYADNAACALPVLQRYAVPATIFVSTGFLNGGRMFNDTVIEAVRGIDAQQLDLREVGLESYSLASVSDRVDAIAAILRAIKHLEPSEREDVAAYIQARARGLPSDLMMTDDQVRSLVSGGMEVGAHTVGHPILASVDEPTAETEIRACKTRLENMLQRDILSFAYPNGRPGIDYLDAHRDMVQRAGYAVAVSTHWGSATAASDPYQLPRFTPWDKQPGRYAARLLLNYRQGDSLLA